MNNDSLNTVRGTFRLRNQPIERQSKMLKPYDLVTDPGETKDLAGKLRDKRG